MIAAGDRLAFAVSILTPDVPLEARAAAAGAAGYGMIESWWPWPTPDPGARSIESFASSIERAGVRLGLLNLWGGSNPGGGGIVGIAAAEEDFRRNLDVAIGMARRLGISDLHALAGSREDGAELATAVERVLRMTDLSPRGTGVVIEPLNAMDRPGYLFNDPIAARDVVADLASRTGGRVGLLADTYHLAKSGLDPVGYIAENASLIRHVQFADFPGRGRPGTGEVDFAGVIRALDAAGYDGWIGLEYAPDGAPVPDYETMRSELRAAQLESDRENV